jgi:hypothetical protein
MQRLGEGIVKRVLLLLLLLAGVSPATAQVPPQGGEGVAVDPIRCWWRTSAGAVRIGEVFDVALTCAVLDNEAVQVVPDESRLGVAVAQMAPFEVVGGEHPPDLRSDGRRFFQYLYRVRIISPDAIGRDIPLPTLTIHYTINSRVAESTSVQGRDLSYLLPNQVVRITSMVPSDAADIRDAGGADFGEVERFSFRASVLDVIALSAVALGALMVIIVIAGLARRVARRTPASEQTLAPRALIGAAATELNAVQRERESGGWSPALTSRALAATRLAATCALGRNASQRLADSASGAGDGRLLTAKGLRTKSRVVSGSATAHDMARAISSAKDAGRTGMLEGFRDALGLFSSAQYGRTDAADQAALDRALSAAVSATAQVKAEHSWIKDLLRQWRTGGTPVESRA